jgi:hypothetical protein
MHVRVPLTELREGEYVVRVGKHQVEARYVGLETVQAGRVVYGPKGGAYRLTAAGATAYRVLVTTKGRPLVDAGAVAVVERDEETTTARTGPPPTPTPAAPQPAREEPERPWEEPWERQASNARTRMARENRRLFPGGCGLCGEPADAEMGEFWNEAEQHGVVAHAQCGIDAGMELA